MTAPILTVQNLSMSFAVRRGGLFAGYAPLRAITDVSFEIAEGETLGVVGESGSGKSTLGRAILRLIEPGAGAVLWRGEDLTKLSLADMRARRRDLQIIFQDPIASLDPRMTIGDSIAEPLLPLRLPSAERRARVLAIMKAVGLSPEMLNRYPHEFSGGQAQRVGIARAVISEPRLIVCDEPVSSLDVSIQAQITTLLRELQRQFGLTLLFISHDLSIVRLIAHRIMVLYLGRVMEIGPRDAVFALPAHPYTRALLASAPIPDPVIARRRPPPPALGEIPSPVNPPSGCPFRTRCPLAHQRCAEAMPPLRPVAAGQQAACWALEN